MKMNPSRESRRRRRRRRRIRRRRRGRGWGERKEEWKEGRLTVLPRKMKLQGTTQAWRRAVEEGEVWNEAKRDEEEAGPYR